MSLTIYIEDLTLSKGSLTLVGNYMNAFVNVNQKHLPPVGNLLAQPMSDKMYYVNQRQ